ncbi:MAG: DUF3822 family protein [Cytophagales bacterium]|nr:DUF3822 family protein [Cytophagales bacterium]
MEATVTRFKQNQLIKDASAFDTESIPQYALNLEVSADAFRLCVVDTHSSRCLWLEEQHFSNVLRGEQLVDQLGLIYDEHEFLRAGFWQKIRVSVKNQYFTLLPNSLFYKEHARQYLKMAAKNLPDAYEVLHYRHPHSEIVNVFAAEREVVEWFRRIYPAKNVGFVHHSSALIEGVLNTDAAVLQSISILVESSHLTILVATGQRLEYCNTFYYVNAQDFIYYTMLVFNELQLSTHVHKVTLYGEISPESAIFEQLHRYVNNVGFGNKPTLLKFGFYFDEVYDHRYFDVYNIHLCE